MSEVDDIIISSIKQIGCDLDKSIDSLETMSADLIVEAISRCLLIIQPNLDISLNSQLPQNMAHRFKIGTKLAACVKGLGYKGEIGYDTFLYSNIIEVRRVFMFLIDKLPKEQHHIVKAENLSPMKRLKLNISIELKNILKKPFTTSKPDAKSCHQHRKFNACCLLTGNSEEVNTKIIDYYSKYLKPAWTQPKDPQDFLASIIHTNALHFIVPYRPTNFLTNSGDRRMAKLYLSQFKFNKETSKISNTTNKSNANNNTVYSLNNNENKTTQIMMQSSTNFPVIIENTENRDSDSSNLDSLKEELSMLLDSIKITTKEINNEASNIKLSEARRIELSSSFKEKIDDIARRKKLLQLLPEADMNLEKLKVMNESQASKLSMLITQFDSLKLALQTELNDLKQQYYIKSSESIKKKELISEMEAEVDQLMIEAQDKESLYNQLLELKELKSDSNRSQYTDRILEIVENIKKQNLEIDKILSESRFLGKEIDSLTGVLERTYLVTEELVFKDAKADESVKKAYKLLVSLHENFGALRKSIEEIGNIKKEISDLDEQLDSRMKSKVEMNLENASRDLQSIRQENRNLILKIKNRHSS